MLLLSVSEDFGGPGKYELVPAMTGINVVLMDGQGDPLDMKATSDPNAGVVGGGGSDPAAEFCEHAVSSSTASRSWSMPILRSVLAPLWKGLGSFLV